MSKWLEIQKCIDEEAQRQEDEICLIASENYMSRDVLSACGSKFINKYAEGYSGHRYYGGCSVVDKLEDLANECARKLFNCRW
jgi:glycine hydroxymethyltransferase